MLMINVFAFCYLTHTVSGDGVANLLGFYTGFRKLCLCRCGIPRSHENYSIRDRYSANDIEMPWLATVHAGTTVIRGTLISDAHVITAANPLYRKSVSEITVTLGSNELCKKGHTLNTSVEAILIHPGYSATVGNNDIALLKLRNPIQFSQFISPICMPIYDTALIDQLAWTTSWVKAYSELCVTRIVTLPVLSSRNCGYTLLNSSMVALTDKNCLGPLGTKSILCENDIGAPVMTRWTPGSPFRLVGVIANTSCESEVSPLFTRTVENLIWIHENIRNNCQCF